MAIRKAKGKRRGFQQGLQKYKIRLHPSGDELGATWKVWIRRIHRLAERCFNYQLRACCMTRAIALTVDPDGTVSLAPRKHRILHYCLVAFALMNTIYKFWVTASGLFAGRMELSTILSAGYFLVFFVPCGLGASCVIRPQVMIDLMKSWPNVASVQGEASHFGSTLASLKVIAIIAMSHGLVALAAGVSLLPMNVPTCVLSICKAIGIIPTLNFPRLLGQILFMPLEAAVNLGPLLLAGFAAQTPMINSGVSKVSGQKLGKLPMQTIGNYEEVLGRYISYQVYNGGVTNNFLIVCFAPTIFSISCTIIVCLFISIRYTGLPIYIYLAFPIISGGLMGVVFDTGYEAAMTVRAAESVLDSLKSPPLFRLLDPHVRLRRMTLIRRAKACRPISFPVGTFSDWNMDVLNSMWDEILNQLLFLLSF